MCQRQYEECMSQSPTESNDLLGCRCVLHTAPLANGVGDNDGLSVPQEPADAPAPAVYVWFTFLASAVACVAGGGCATPQCSPGAGGSTADYAASFGHIPSVRYNTRPQSCSHPHGAAGPRPAPNSVHPRAAQRDRPRGPRDSPREWYRQSGSTRLLPP